MLFKYDKFEISAGTSNPHTKTSIIYSVLHSPFCKTFSKPRFWELFFLYQIPDLFYYKSNCLSFSSIETKNLISSFIPFSWIIYVYLFSFIILQRTMFTKINVWVTYLYWSGAYPTGPDDASRVTRCKVQTQSPKFHGPNPYKRSPNIKKNDCSKN